LADFANYCAELLSCLGAVRTKRMFGGHGVYADGVFVAIIVNETLYLKVDDETRAQFEQAGCRPFEYTARGGERHSMSYWSVPSEAMDSPGLMTPWARLAMDAALRAQAAKAPGRRRRGPRQGA
jgi:DNA transformation protein